jgi:hypothetical protein
MPATLPLEAARPATEEPVLRRVLGFVLAGFTSRSYPLLGPMCIWLPYPPHPPRTTRRQGDPDTEAEARRH